MPSTLRVFLESQVPKQSRIADNVASGTTDTSGPHNTDTLPSPCSVHPAAGGVHSGATTWARLMHRK
jgi:hypothetical protein